MLVSELDFFGIIYRNDLVQILISALGLTWWVFQDIGKCSTIPWVDPFPPFHVSFLSSCAEVSRIQLSLSAALDLTRSVFAWNLRFRITEVHKSVGWLSD